MVLIIGLTGMPGSGKGACQDAAKLFKIPVMSMGDIVRAEAENLGLPLTCEVLGGIALCLRAEGNDAIAKRIYKKVQAYMRKNPSTKAILVDGIRSLEELKYFRKKFDKFELIAIYSPPKTRFERLLKRNRSDDYGTWKEFQNRDFREILLGIGGAIALADHIVLNTGTLEELQNSSENTVRNILSNYY